MHTKPLVKSLITVKSVRVANGRVMGYQLGTPAPAAPSIRAIEKLGSVAQAGQRAMESTKK